MTNPLSSRFLSFIPFKLRTVEFLLLLAVLASLVFANACAADSTPPSLVILPPANKTSSPTLDWLAVGIQDTMNVDLWGISSARTRAITEYGNLTGYNLMRMASLDAEAAVKLAQDAKVDLVWRGEYALVDNYTITLTYWSLNAKNGTMLHKQEIKGPLDEIASIISRMTISMLSPSGIPATKQEIDRISKPVTRSFKAFEQNSLGFGKQLQRSTKRGGMMSGKHDWIQHCQKAVALDPEYAEAYVNLGWALHSDGSSEAAFTAFSAAIKLKPYLLDGWMGLGYIHRDRGANGMALDAFQKAMAINSHLEWPREELKKMITAVATTAIKVDPKQQSLPLSDSQAVKTTLSADEKQLLDLIEQGSLDIRMDAIKSIAQSKKAQALPFLKQMINKPDQAFEVLKLMVNISIPESAPYLIEALEKRIVPDGSRLSTLTEQNVLGVIQLIKRRSLHQAIPVLIRTLDDSSTTVRESAALTLGDLGKQEAVEPLRKFAVTERNPQARIAALVALVKLGDAKSEEMLKTVFSEGKDMDIINYATKLMKQRKIKLGEK